MAQRINIQTLLMFLAACLLGISCKDLGSDNLPQSGAVSFSKSLQPIFNNNCISCHGIEAGLTLSQGVSFGMLLYVPAQSSCVGLYRVLPGNADSSVLYRKVSGTSCGARMPQGGILSGQEIGLVRDWINQGALNN